MSCSNVTRLPGAVGIDGGEDEFGPVLVGSLPAGFWNVHAVQSDDLLGVALDRAPQQFVLVVGQLLKTPRDAPT